MRSVAARVGDRDARGRARGVVLGAERGSCPGRVSARGGRHECAAVARVRVPRVRQRVRVDRKLARGEDVRLFARGGREVPR